MNSLKFDSSAQKVCLNKTTVHPILFFACIFAGDTFSQARSMQMPFLYILYDVWLVDLRAVIDIKRIQTLPGRVIVRELNSGRFIEFTLDSRELIKFK